MLQILFGFIFYSLKQAEYNNKWTVSIIFGYIFFKVKRVKELLTIENSPAIYDNDEFMIKKYDKSFYITY